MRTRPAPKDMPLEWEEIFAAWLLLLLGLGLFLSPGNMVVCVEKATTSMRDGAGA